MHKLTLKQRVFLKEYIKHRNGTKAVMIAYCTNDPNTAGAIASENLRKPKISDAIEKIMNLEGLSLQSLASRLKDIITNPKPEDAVSVKAIDTFGRWTGLDHPRSVINIESPKSPEEVQSLIDRMKSNVKQ